MADVENKENVNVEGQKEENNENQENMNNKKKNGNGKKKEEKTYTKKDIERLEKELKNAKDYVRKESEKKERSRRSNQMCKFGGELEKGYKELFDKKLFLADNQNIVEYLQNFIIKTVFTSQKSTIQKMIEENLKKQEEQQNNENNENKPNTDENIKKVPTHCEYCGKELHKSSEGHLACIAYFNKFNGNENPDYEPDEIKRKQHTFIKKDEIEEK